MAKIIIPILLLFTFAGLLSLNNEMTEAPEYTFNSYNEYSLGLLKSESDNVVTSAEYFISAELNTDDQFLTVSEDIKWINNTNFPAEEIQFHLYANAYKSNNTVFAGGNEIPDESLTYFEIQNVSANGLSTELHYFQPDIQNPNDSTAAKIILNKPLVPGDSILLHFDYKLKIPQSINGFGYATGRNFYFVSDWYPKVAVFKNGKWICSQYHQNGNTFSDFSDYKLSLSVPENYVVSGTGIAQSKIMEGNRAVYNIQQAAVNDFAWFATDEILHFTEGYKRLDGTQIQIELYLQPEREGYHERYLNALRNSLKFFEENIGAYPYQSLVLLDVPRTCTSENLEKPNLFTVHADLFSPEDARELELQTVRGFSQLFFKTVFSVNKVTEAWLEEGIAYYFAEKIMSEYFDQRNITFRLAKYFPIYGLNFLAHYEIPIIYTLGIYKYKEDSEGFIHYLPNRNLGNIAHPSYKLPTRSSYEVNSIYKPHLMLLSLERYIGKENLFNLFSKYYNEYKFKQPGKSEFVSVVKNNIDEDISWFFENILEQHYTFDYRLNSVEKISNDTYEVFVQRSGEGYFKSEVVLYTESDTLKKIWDGKERWKKFIFKTDDEVYAAEIDPGRKNVLDTNYANNSIALGGRYVASFSMAMRVFFWIQNALLILGSIG